MSDTKPLDVLPLDLRRHVIAAGGIMAQHESGGVLVCFSPADLAKFAALVAARCVQIAGDHNERGPLGDDFMEKFIAEIEAEFPTS